MKNKNNIITSTLFIIILTLQIIAIIYAVSKREYYHIDELYSYGLMQYDRAFIFDNEDFYNTWHTSEYFKDYLRINEENKWDFSAVYKNQIEDVHPPVYYLLLRISNTFNIGNFSIWPGTILNIIIFIFSSIMIYLISKKIFKSDYMALIVCFFSGFSLASIETVMYNRMYQLFILNILILIYWHIKKIEVSQLDLKDLISLCIMVILGFLTHYYYAIIAVILYIIYMFRYIKEKNIQEAAKYTLTLFASALISIIIFPYSIKHIFFGYRGKEVLSSNNFNNAIYKLIENFKIINKEFFNGYMLIILSIFIITLIIAMIKYLITKKELKFDNTENIKYIAIPTILYILIAAIVSPYCDLRYMMPAIPITFICIIYAFYNIIKYILDTKITFIIICILVVIFSITTIPMLSNNSYTYVNYKAIKNNIEKNNLKNKPCIAFYIDASAQYTKIMEAYQAFITFDESYIMTDNVISSDNISKALENKNISEGIIIITLFSQSEDIIKQIMNTGNFKDVYYQGRMYRFDVFLVK